MITTDDLLARFYHSLEGYGSLLGNVRAERLVLFLLFSFPFLSFHLLSSPFPSLPFPSFFFSFSFVSFYPPLLLRLTLSCRTRRETDRMLRDEQDAAYRQSLLEDEEKERKLREEQERTEREERERTEREAEEERERVEREQAKSRYTFIPPFSYSFSSPSLSLPSLSLSASLLPPLTHH